jgi:hypothetical protein
VKGTLEATDRLTEDQFENMARGKGLSEVEREALRKYYGLPCNEELLSSRGFWQHHAVMAARKVKFAR